MVTSLVQEKNMKKYCDKVKVNKYFPFIATHWSY